MRCRKAVKERAIGVRREREREREIEAQADKSEITLRIRLGVRQERRGEDEETLKRLGGADWSLIPYVASHLYPFGSAAYVIPDFLFFSWRRGKSLTPFRRMNDRQTWQRSKRRFKKKLYYPSAPPAESRRCYISCYATRQAAGLQRWLEVNAASPMPSQPSAQLISRTSPLLSFFSLQFGPTSSSPFVVSLPHHPFSDV